MDDKSASVPAPRTERTRIQRHPERAVPDRVEEFLRAGLIAFVGYVEDGEPRVIPLLYHYDAGCLYIHGSPSGGTLKLVADGRPVTVSMARIDALVASKLESGATANYRSVIVYGHGRVVEDVAEKRPIMRAMAKRYFPDRDAPGDFAPATDRDLSRMELVAIDIDEAQAKARTGPAGMPGDSDPAVPGTSFIREI